MSLTTKKLVAQVLLKQFDNLDTLGNLSPADGLIDRGDLKAAVRNARAPKEVKLAAQAALDMFKEFDVAGNGAPMDGLVAKRDFEAVLNRFVELTPSPKSKAADRLAATILWNQFDKLDTLGNLSPADGLIDRHDLQVAALNPLSTAEVRLAAQAGMEMFNELDIAGNHSPADGLIGKCDVEAVMNDRRVVRTPAPDRRNPWG